MINLTDDQRSVQATARRFANEQLGPGAAERDAGSTFPREAWDAAAGLGFLGITAPERLGGAELGLVEVCLIGEELSAVDLAGASSLMHQAELVVDSIVRNGTPEQQEQHLPGLCAGTTVGCLAITEPEAGSDALAMQTTAARVDGGWSLRGTKSFITLGPIADLALVYARTGAPGSRELGLFLVPTDAPGFTRGSKLDKLGWRSSPTGELALDDVFVPEDQVLGGAGSGLSVLVSGLNGERILMGAQSVGLARGAFDLALAYARERRQFGRPIGDFQLIRAKLADMYVEIEACRALTYAAAAAVDAGGDLKDLPLRASASKLMGSEVAMRAANHAVQVLGGYGYTKEYAAERFLRDARLLEIGGGTSEIMRDLLGKTLMRSGPGRV